MLNQDKAESAVEDEGPVVALVGAQVGLGVVAPGGEDELVGLDPPGSAGQRQDGGAAAGDRTQVDARVAGRRCVDQLVQGDAVHAGQGQQLFESGASQACFEPGQRAGRDAGLFGEVAHRDVAALSQLFEARYHGLERASASAVAGRVQRVQADLSVWTPDAQYDLVITHYAHPAMPQLDFYERITAWVTPAGTLLVVGHLHHGDEDCPPGSASVRAADITARLDPTVWEFVTATEPHRILTGHGGREVALHDVVVRADRCN